jgi:riboflavin synthase
LFTGLVAEVGKVAGVFRTGETMTFTVSAAAVSKDIDAGDSISVNGACQTVTGKREGGFTFYAVSETLRRTNLGSLGPGSEVNLETALRLGDRIGGHLVSGHIDATGTVRRRRVVGAGNIDFGIQIPDGLGRYVRTKGSIALDGVSLTVKAVKGSMLEVTVIPYTIENTIIGNWRVGTAVNVEVDQLAKYLSPEG